MNRLVTTGFALALSTFGTTGFAQDTGAQLSNCDTQLDVASAPQKAIVYNTPAIENMLALGLEDRIFGVIDSVTDEETGAPWDGAKSGLNHLARGNDVLSEEAFLALEPDFVYAAFHWYLHSDETASRDTLASFGIPSYLSPAECGGQQTEASGKVGFETIFAELRDLADIFDVEARGEELVTALSGRVDAALAKLDSDAAPTMLWYYSGTDAPYVAGCCGAPGALSELVGGKNIYGDDPALWPVGNWEVIVERDPDVIIIGDLNRAGEGQSAADKIAFLEADPVTSAMSAVRNKNYIIIPGREMDPSARTIMALERIVDALSKGQND